jgi:hypothetical protein
VYRGVVRWWIGLVVLAGCIAQVQGLISPAPATAGTSTCREIVETCDSACTDPLCLHGCTAHGTTEAQQQHGALLDCAERNGCTDEGCVRGNCPTEATTCEGPPAAAP